MGFFVCELIFSNKCDYDSASASNALESTAIIQGIGTT
ncbi:hypothetical protein GAGA_0832 [Paraglaciecola agarilytica NO2]|uniref:Uncharacterized protein n=1 Tax=Paraglaciecola agarilytica NO2 TaxID=1125747 RepID=A0ABQ0I2Y6_9ALTE|nr:hypothetical protein GAGA_0832 [Paraglaciecola agarilytica NO2]